MANDDNYTTPLCIFTFYFDPVIKSFYNKSKEKRQQTHDKA